MNTMEENKELIRNKAYRKPVANCDRFSDLKHSSVNPFAFTEQGVAMLSAVLKSETEMWQNCQASRKSSQGR